MNNASQAFQILDHLHQQGVRSLVLCPGGRSAPWLDILSIEKHPFEIYTHPDERSAGFFALGLSQAKNRPVAVIITSGTAVSETLSAVIEAHYSSTPLIILSADRPRSYRGSGAPQAIRQVELLKPYVAQVYDLEKENLKIRSWNKKSPLHINVSFDEPLIDSVKAPFHFSVSSSEEGEETEPRNKSEAETNLFKENLSRFFQTVKKPLMVVSGSHGFDSESLLPFLKNLRIPVFFESTSGLKKRDAVKDFEIEFPEKIFSEGKVNGVIRLGHVPTHRFWRDLEALKFPVLNFSHHPFSGLSWSRETYSLHRAFDLPWQDLKHPDFSAIKESDLRLREKKREGLKKYPKSEPALIRSLQEFWSANDLVYLGNSLPIREWDYVQDKSFTDLSCSRGANGIDGQISTFLGRAAFTPKALGVFGDLTALYDMNAPWFSKYLNGLFYLAVINNRGGMIFDRLFGKDIYLNRHEFHFESLAKMWNLKYQVFDPSVNPFGSSPTVIEVLPDDQETSLFWKFMK